ncbi:MAG: radical SAM protein, partial [Spirochaetales bacterium]|nr:radical SAM protein [Spirochaetales bacterium]
MESKVSQYPFNLITKPIGPLCNLHCAYCFYLSKEELFFHEKKKEYIMSPKVLERYVKEYIQSQPPTAQEVVFAWQGGEPTLLGTGFFEDVLRLQKKHNIRNIKISNSIQTNGTLITDEMARFFKENDFLVGISIDGPEELHNRYRLNRSGKDSFHQVMAGIEKLKKHSVEFNTLTVVQDDNSKHPLEVYNFL